MLCSYHPWNQSCADLPAMGNTSPATAPGQSEEGFKVKHMGHAFVNDICQYDFFVEPPAGELFQTQLLDAVH